MVDRVGDLGSRRTEQRRALIDFLATADRYLSAREIHAELARQGRPVSLATTYRTVALLARAGVLDVLPRDDGEASYIVGSERHHHHLVCRRCGRSEEITNPAVEQWADDEATRRGYSAVTHALTVFGICPACRGLGD